MEKVSYVVSSTEWMNLNVWKQELSIDEKTF